VKNIFVGNLTFQTTESDLGDLFKAFGQVTRVHVAIDRDTGRSRGFAFVEMAVSGNADRAIAALNGTMVGDRALNVNEARRKLARAGHSPGGGFRGWRGRARRW